MEIAKSAAFVPEIDTLEKVTGLSPMLVSPKLMLADDEPTTSEGKESD